MKNMPLKWIFLSLLALIWGSSFILIMRGLDGLSPIQLGSLRMVFAGLFLLAIGFRKLPEIPLGKWKYIALTGICGNFIPAFLFAIAETKINSSITAVLNSLTPLNTLIFGALLFSLNFKRNQVVGIIVGFTGCLVLIFGGSQADPSGNIYFALLVFAATICYALNINFIKQFLPDLSPLTISAGNFAVLLLPSLAILGFTGFFSQLHTPQVQHSMVFILILGVFGTGLSNVLFYRLIQMSTPVFASSVTYLIPIVACVWGIMAEESFTWLQQLGAVVILSGVYLSSRK